MQPMQPSPSTPELALENCDREPIHVPGSIQPHGALLALDRLGRLSHLRAREEDGFAVLAITNDAPPIPGDVATALFDPFKRQSTANDRNRTGMGLGLYIAHQVVRGHQGTLVHIGGDGTVTFEARIPLRRAAGDA